MVVSAMSFVNTLIVGSLLYIVWVVIKRKMLYPDDRVDRKMPGPELKPFFGNVLEMIEDPLFTFQRWRKKYGGVFKYYYFRDPVVVVTNPKGVRYVLKDHSANFVKDRDPIIIDVIGNGLLLTNGALWKRHRKIMSPAFGPLYIRKTIPAFVDACSELVSKLETFSTSDQFNLHLFMTMVTLDVIGLAGFGYTFGTIRDSSGKMPRAVTSILEETERRIFQIIPWWKLSWLPSTKKFRADKNTVIQEIFEMMRKRKEEGEDQLKKAKDLLGRLLVAKDPESGDQLGPEQLKDELITFLIAGHETTAASLAFTFYLISTHPEVEERVVREIDRVMGDKEPTWDIIQNLSYLSLVMKESMRLYPSVAMQTTRRTLEDDFIEDYFVPAGTFVELWPWLLHRSEDLWDEPEKFKPERFEEGTYRDKYMPFGLGPRNCIGMHLASAESKVILAMTLRRFKFSMAAGHKMKPVLSITLRPADLIMTVTRREL